MEKQYVYVVHFEKRTIFSTGEYSTSLFRNDPIKDLKSVEKIIRRKHPFSKCTVLWFKLT